MPRFSRHSKSLLSKADPRLQLLMNESIKIIDFKIVCSIRSKQKQNYYYNKKLSRVKYPNSKHNVDGVKRIMAEAIDLYPYLRGKGISYNIDQCYFVAGVIIAVANRLNIPIRWGGDWNRNKNITDNKFNDLGHFELC